MQTRREKSEMKGKGGALIGFSLYQYQQTERALADCAIHPSVHIWIWLYRNYVDT